MIKWINKLFSIEKQKIIYPYEEILIVVGNIGAEYVNTRHNIGFKIVDFLAKENVTFETVKLGALATFKGRTFFC
jgi:PTH1 family peptidyl-tRNA hydrolase